MRSYMFRISDAHLGGHLGEYLQAWTDEGVPVREIRERLSAEGCQVGLATVWRWVAHLERLVKEPL